MKHLAATGQDLVAVSLVADVPDQLVMGSIEDVMKGDGKFDDPEGGAKMTSVHGNHVDDIIPQFSGHLIQVLLRELAQILGESDGFQ